MYACGKHGLVYVITAPRQQYHPTKDNENLLVVSSRVPCRTELLPGRDKAVSPEPLGGLEWSSARRPKGANCRRRRDLRRLAARGPDGDAAFPSRPWQAQANDAVSAKRHVSCPGDLLRRVHVPFRNPPVSPNGVPLCRPQPAGSAMCPCHSHHHASHECFRKDLRRPNPANSAFPASRTHKKDLHSVNHGRGAACCESCNSAAEQRSMERARSTPLHRMQAKRAVRRFRSRFRWSGSHFLLCEPVTTRTHRASAHGFLHLCVLKPEAVKHTFQFWRLK